MDRAFFVRLLVAASLVVTGTHAAAIAQTATVFEGARLITGDGNVIENAAFLVEGNRFVAAGRRADVLVPKGAARVDLTGKTVMPTMTDLHGHIGYQNVPAGTMSKEMFTHDNLIDHLQRLAYHGVGAVISIGDLIDRADGHGGRTGWGDVPLRLRNEVIPGAALFKTAGAGLSWPGSGAQGHPSRADVMYGVTTEEEARAAVQDYVRMQPEFIKIWVDDRGGRKPTLTPPLYRAVIEEAHRHNVPVGVHNVKLADAKELLRAGVEGWLHVPVRGGEHVDEETIAIVKNRILRNDHPKMWITPSLHSAWMNTSLMNTPSGQRPAWLDDPLLKETYSPASIEQHWSEPQRQNIIKRFVAREFEEQGRNLMQLRAAGMRVVMGTDTGQNRHWIGYSTHMALESFVAVGMTPGEAIVASTRDSADIGGFNTGLVAPGRQADFIVLDANPLDSIANSRRISRVYLRGEEVPRAAMTARWRSQFRSAAAR